MAYKNKADAQAYARAYQQANKEELNVYAREYAAVNREKIRAYGVTHRTKAKLEVLSFYGPNKEARCSWPGCDVSDIDMLCLDHVDNDGASRRKKGERSGGHFYISVRKSGFPSGYQTLCCNHNTKKEILRLRAA